MNYATYDTATGRIDSHGTAAQLWEQLPVAPDVTSGSHYITWTATDANGRPVDPTPTPRTLLEAVVGEQVGDTVTVTIPTDQVALEVRVDGVAQSVAAEGGMVTVTLTSSVDHTWGLSVDEVARYLPDLLVSVTHAA